MFGTRVGKKSERKQGWKPLFYVNVVSARAVAWMNRILPYMGQRRSEKIKDLLAQYDGLYEFPTFIIPAVGL